jgi:hypothetical protein
MEENGDIETFYYNSHELDYSDDDDDDDDDDDEKEETVNTHLSTCGGAAAGRRHLRKRSSTFEGHWQHSGNSSYNSGVVTSPTQAISTDHDDDDSNDNVEDSTSNDMEEDNTWDDSLEGSMYFVNNESTLLEFSLEELVAPHIHSRPL